MIIPEMIGVVSAVIAYAQLVNVLNENRKEEARRLDRIERKIFILGAGLSTLLPHDRLLDDLRD